MKDPDEYIERLPETMVERILRCLAYFVIGVLLALIIAVLSACGPARVVDPKPVDAHCDKVCYMPCVEAEQDTGTRWEGDPNSSKTLDNLDDVVIPELSAKLRTCETRRQACQKCLDNLETNSIITPQH